MARKYGVHFKNPIPNYDTDPSTLIGDIQLPYVTIIDVEIALPCGKEQVIEALKMKGVTIPDPDQQAVLIAELLVEIEPYSTKVAAVVAKRTPKRR